MTYTLPILTGTAGTILGGPVVGGVAAFTGWLMRYSEGGHALTNLARTNLKAAVYRGMAANWGARPVFELYEPGDRQVLLQAMFESTTEEALQSDTDQWALLQVHIFRAYESGIPPWKAIRFIKSHYRDSIFAKRQKYALALSRPVIQAYMHAHPAPEQDYSWYERWANEIGFTPAEAREMWDQEVRAFKVEQGMSQLELEENFPSMYET